MHPVVPPSLIWLGLILAAGICVAGVARIVHVVREEIKSRRRAQKLQEWGHAENLTGNSSTYTDGAGDATRREPCGTGMRAFWLASVCRLPGRPCPWRAPPN